MRLVPGMILRMSNYYNILILKIIEREYGFVLIYDFEDLEIRRSWLTAKTLRNHKTKILFNPDEKPLDKDLEFCYD